MEAHFALFTDDQPQIGDFVYNTTAGTVDRVTQFDMTTRYTVTKQCTIEAAIEHKFQVIDINKLTQPGVIKTLKTLEVMGKSKGVHANHTDYSNYTILKMVEERKTKAKAPAIREAAQALGLSYHQANAKYYELFNDGITSDDLKEYTQQDVLDFDPGQGPVIKTSSSRKTFPEGYDKHDDNWTPSGSYQGDPGDEQPATAKRPVVSKPKTGMALSMQTLENNQSAINPMRTVLVTYTTQQTPLTEKQIRENKLYAFNTPSEMKKGDIIKSDSYTTPMQVVDVLDKPSTYYNRSTGELSDVFTSTEQRKLATLIIREDDSNTVYAKFVAKKV